MQENRKGKRASTIKNPKIKKEQSAFEFITTYGWAILILAVVIVMLYYFVGIPATSVPNECKFIYGSNCQGIIATSLASSTRMTLVITNSQSYPIFNPLIKVATDSYGNLSAACLPTNTLVDSGSEIICNVTIPQKISPGQTITGTIYLSITACPSGNINNCQPEQLQTYKGDIITRVTSQSSNIHLTSTSTSSTSSTSTSTSSTSSTSTSTTSTSTSTSTSTVSCTPGSQSYTAAGTYQFTTPSNCGTSTTYTISLVGAGGSGAITQVAWCTRLQDTQCGRYSGAGGGGGGYEVVDASGLSAGTPITVNVGAGGPMQIGPTTQGGASTSGGTSPSGGPSNVIATNLAASAGGGGGATAAFEIDAASCSYQYSSVPGSGGTNAYSGSAITSVVTNDVGQTAPWTLSNACTNSPGGDGGNAGGNLGSGGAGGVGSANALSGGNYGGGGGGASASGTTAISGYSGGGGSGEVIISWN